MAIDILADALRQIETQTIQYQSFLRSDINEYGYEVPIFSDLTTIEASVQPVTQIMMYRLGLDFDKIYFSVWSQADLKNSGRDRVADRVIYNGRLFDVINVDDWQPSTYSHFLMVDIGVAP